MPFNSLTDSHNASEYNEGVELGNFQFPNGFSLQNAVNTKEDEALINFQFPNGFSHHH